MDYIQKLLLLMLEKFYIEERLKNCETYECVNLECALRRVTDIIDMERV